jgi:ABC-type multidrug transport system fused ATPase/permease subunit
MEISRRPGPTGLRYRGAGPLPPSIGVQGPITPRSGVGRGSAGCQGVSAGYGRAVRAGPQPGGMTYSIIADGLVKRFGQTRALNGINLAVPTGSVFGLLGPNGAGKTTAVRILATLVRPDGGHAAVCGHDVVRNAHQVR